MGVLGIERRPVGPNLNAGRTPIPRVGPGAARESTTFQMYLLPLRTLVADKREKKSLPVLRSLVLQHWRCRGLVGGHPLTFAWLERLSSVWGIGVEFGYPKSI